jgi:hypothetical protein
VKESAMALFFGRAPLKKAGRVFRSNLFWQKKPKKDFHFNRSRKQPSNLKNFN